MDQQLTVSDVDFMLGEWGKWARVNDLRKIGYPSCSPEQKVPGKTWPAENAEAELVDSKVATLDDYQQHLLVMHFVGDSFGGRLTINGMASHLGWDRRKVKTELNLAIGIVCGMLRECKAA